jgi:DNA-directed RNA polymerase specialized sigma24 family protein
MSPMDVLQVLSKDDKKWRSYALAICRDKLLADDLVQEMYLKFHRNKYTRTQASYVYWCIFNLFRDHLRLSKDRLSITIFENTLFEFQKDIEASDVEKLINEKLEKHDLYYGELALINSDGKSLRKLEYLYKKKYSTIHFNITKIKEALIFDNELRDLYLSLK